MYRNASVIRRSDIRQPKASGTAPNPEKKAESLAASEQLLKKPATAKISESCREAEDYTRGAAIGREGGHKERRALIGCGAYKRQASAGDRREARERPGRRFLCAGGGAGAGARAAQAEERDWRAENSCCGRRLSSACFHSLSVGESGVELQAPGLNSLVSPPTSSRKQTLCVGDVVTRDLLSLPPSAFLGALWPPDCTTSVMFRRVLSEQAP